MKILISRGPSFLRVPPISQPVSPQPHTYTYTHVRINVAQHTAVIFSPSMNSPALHHMYHRVAHWRHSQKINRHSAACQRHRPPCNRIAPTPLLAPYLSLVLSGSRALGGTRRGGRGHMTYLRVGSSSGQHDMVSKELRADALPPSSPSSLSLSLMSSLHACMIYCRFLFSIHDISISSCLFMTQTILTAHTYETSYVLSW